MSLFNPAQVEELGVISRGLMTQIRGIIRGDDPPAATSRQLLSELHIKYGLAGAAFVIRSWLDMVIEACPAVRRGEEYAVAFANPDGDGFADPNGLDHAYRWAAAALAARICDDQVRLYQMIDGLPRDDRIRRYLIRTGELAAGVLENTGTPRAGGMRAGDVICIDIAQPT